MRLLLLLAVLGQWAVGQGKITSVGDPPKEKGSITSSGYISIGGESGDPNSTSAVGLIAPAPDHGENWILPCENFTPETGVASGCKLRDGDTLDHAFTVILSAQIRQSREQSRCGNFGAWIQDQNGSVMYRRRNPPCPKNPPKGPRSYDICDLRAIGMQGLPESATPRTLSNPSEPRPWTDGELKEFCKSKASK